MAPVKLTPQQQVQKQLLAAVHKAWGAEAALRLGDGESRCDVRQVIPTGLSVVDNHVLVVGGFPCGRITELFGGEGGGKTSLGLAGIAQVQRMGGQGIILETEHALQTSRVATLGANLDDVTLEQPDTLEQTLGCIETTIDAMPDETPGLILWDSVAATPTQAEVEAGVLPEKEGMAEFARVMSRGLRVLVGKLARKRVALVCVNQLRSKVGVVFGNPETTPGGNALKYYASVRLSVSAGTAVKAKGDSGDVVGRDALVKTLKNKLAPPYREARVRLLYSSGWDERWSTVNAAKDLGAIPESAKLTDATYRAALEALAADPYRWAIPAGLLVAEAP